MTQSGEYHRMRLVLLALFSLVLVAPQAADAARREEPRTQASRPQAAAPQARSSAQRPVAAQARTAARPAAREAARPQQTVRAGDVRTQRTGIVVRGASAATVSREAAASCTRRNGRTVCGPARSGIAGWQAGLPVADYAQTDCPAGTFATLARGHENVVRCMPL
jgi:pyruvate/2-oxoglutarate dehydrogenase complex dihydrolipoamide acyltransferase (E2) component